MAVPHTLLVPYPAQGHVDPLMELCHRIAKLGILVTLVHTEFRHALVMVALPENFSNEYHEGIQLESIPNDAANDDERGLGFYAAEWCLVSADRLSSVQPVYWQHLVCIVTLSYDAEAPPKVETDSPVFVESGSDTTVGFYAAEWCLVSTDRLSSVQHVYHQQRLKHAHATPVRKRGRKKENKRAMDFRVCFYEVPTRDIK
ncbi:hypothetical protein EJ110_NYTH21247 [Nymphaea thermarum]|nr:hypothetical protein EJ110_NYTH21247 [Nymphaea thermarum]